MPIIFSFTLLFSLFLSPLQGEIQEIKSFQEIPSPVDGDWFFCDVDHTLITPQDPILQPGGIRLAKSLIPQYFYTEQATYPIEHLKTLPYPKEALCMLMEAEILSLIEQWQKASIPVFAFTALTGGELEGFGHVGNWRVNQLQKLGLDFSQALPDLAPIEFSPTSYHPIPPSFQQGVLFSSRSPKGAVLHAFLLQLPVLPQRILFVDDHLSHLQSVQASLDELGIPFLGYHYQPDLASFTEVDEEIAHFQIEHLANQGVWLSTSAAQKQLNARTP